MERHDVVEKKSVRRLYSPSPRRITRGRSPSKTSTGERIRTNKTCDAFFGDDLSRRPTRGDMMDVCNGGQTRRVPDSETCFSEVVSNNHNPGPIRSLDNSRRLKTRPRTAPRDSSWEHAPIRSWPVSCAAGWMVYRWGESLGGDLVLGCCTDD